MGGFVGQLANYYGGCLLQAGATFSESTCAEALPKFVRARGTSFNTPHPFRPPRTAPQLCATDVAPWEQLVTGLCFRLACKHLS